MARRERGNAERKGKKTDRGDSRRSASPQTHCSSSHPLSPTTPLADTEHSENKLRLFTATLIFFLSLFSFSPRCPCAHISLYHTHADRVRLKQHAGDIQRGYYPGCVGIRRGPLFHFVPVSIRIGGRKTTTWTEHRHQSLPIKASPSGEKFYKHSEGCLHEHRSSLSVLLAA